ncbi:MAG: phenylalanine--tRNA ligase subunit alpha [Lachnospiraceae bacterium]|nr:phenylalanine--tRNA ligase subunit alpha [Lachnospiraceae bacterium]MBR4174822.1 phenylalanine--tRNA ligase subunit alpha [Lachnospiraceae bacterium]
MADFNDLKQKLEQELSAVSDNESLSSFWQAYLGKTGAVSALMKEMKNIPADEKKEYGKQVNELRAHAQQLYDEKKCEIDALELQKRYEAEDIDVTIPSDVQTGNLHPITLIRQEMIDVFAGMGFEVLNTPEIEDDDTNFTLLNVLKDHPARDMQDTFYVSDNYVLRTHTTGGDIHVMKEKKPPIKALNPGRTFRSDSDATHSPMFSQMDILVVDKGINLCDLQGMLDEFVQQIFNKDVKTRLRPSYFPFTEPSVEVDVSCFNCGGKGCPLCKGTGWIEILGGGILNKVVLENCGIDPEEYSALAAGIGIERIAMLKYGIKNMGQLFENDLEFLKQFRA